MIDSYTLPNGLRVILAPQEGTKTTTVLVLTQVGSRYERPEINGASHFIEHLMFKGTKKRPTSLDISRSLDSVGASYNAYTGKNMTGYYVKADAAHGELAVDLLHDMLFSSLFDEKEMNKERGVIIEEINMYKDNPMIHVEELAEAALFKGSTLGWDIAGSHQTVNEMKRDAVMAFHKEHYIPSKMVVVVAGKIGRGIKGLIKETFGEVPKAEHQPCSFQKFTLPSNPAEIQRVNFEHKDTSQMQLAITFPSYGIDDSRTLVVSLLSTILGGSMSSRLFVSVREKKGLAYSIRAGNSPYEETGAFIIQAGLDKSRLNEAMETIEKEVVKMSKEGVTATELHEAKDNIHGRTLIRLEDSAELAEWYGRQEMFLTKIKSPDARLKDIEKITKSQIQEVAEDLLDLDKMRVGAIGPYKEESGFIKAAGLEV